MSILIWKVVLNTLFTHKTNHIFNVLPITTPLSVPSLYVANRWCRYSRQCVRVLCEIYLPVYVTILCTLKNNAMVCSLEYVQFTCAIAFDTLIQYKQEANESKAWISVPSTCPVRLWIQLTHEVGESRHGHDYVKVSRIWSRHWHERFADDTFA